jgi:hypothetical protein
MASCKLRARPFPNQPAGQGVHMIDETPAYGGLTCANRLHPRELTRHPRRVVKILATNKRYSASLQQKTLCPPPAWLKIISRCSRP